MACWASDAVLAVWVTAVVVLAPAVTGNQYVAYNGIKFAGTLMHVFKVETLVMCGSFCQSQSCPGFCLEGTTAPFNCSPYSAINYYTEDPTSKVYYDAASPPTFLAYKGIAMVVYPHGGPGLTWDEAKAWCAARSAKMFIPTSTADWNWMSNITESFEYFHTWIPATDIAVEGTLQWEDGTSAMNSAVITWEFNDELASNTDADDWVIGHLGADILVAHFYPFTTKAGVICQKIIRLHD